ncbi:MAG: hypothetical protein E7361_04080 [Clostridiales bacterium]|nr:hypothetical protein [Clostridiales bacterium]
MENTENNKSVLSKTALYIIFGISILLIISIILNVYFYAKSRIRVYDISLGEDIDVKFNEQGSTIIANIVYPSNIVSGTTHDQEITLSSGDITTSYYVRAKAMYADYNIVNESIDIHLSPSFQWVQDVDNYYYLKSPISDWAEIPFIDKITLPEITTDVRNNTIISVIFEFLDTNIDVSAVWKVNADIFGA